MSSEPQSTLVILIIAVVLNLNVILIVNLNANVILTVNVTVRL